MGLATFASGVSLGLSLSLFGLEDSYSKRKDARAGRDAEGYRDVGGLDLDATIPIYPAYLAFSLRPWMSRDFFFSVDRIF